MSDFEKRAFIAASGQVLTVSLPENYDDENWSSDEHEDVDDWIVAHAQEPFEHWEAKYLWKQIDSVADTLKEFHKSEVEVALESCKVEVIKQETLVKIEE